MIGLCLGHISNVFLPSFRPTAEIHFNLSTIQEGLLGIGFPGGSNQYLSAVDAESVVAPMWPVRETEWGWLIKTHCSSTSTFHSTFTMND